MGGVTGIGELVEILKGGGGDIAHGLAGKEGLVAAENDIGESGQAHELIIVDDGIGKIFEEDAFLFLVNINTEGAELAGFEGMNDGIRLDEFTAAGIDEHGTRFHAGEGVLIDQVPCFGEERDMEADNIGGGEQIVEGLEGDAGIHKILLRPNIIGDDPATEAEKDAADRVTDFAGADDAGRFAAEIKAHEAIEGEVGATDAVVGAMNAPIEREHEADGVFSDAVRRISGHAGDTDTVVGGGLEIDIVVTGGANGDIADAQLAELAENLGIDPVVNEDADGILALGKADRVGGKPWFEEGEVVAVFRQIEEELPVIVFGAENGNAHRVMKHGRGTDARWRVGCGGQAGAEIG